MNAHSALGTIYLGAPIELASEREAIAAVVARLEEAQTPYLIIANVQIGGRQFDCIVATATAATLIEVKVSRSPVRGTLNGPWARLDAGGSWRPYGNAYQQALGAKNALRDMMSAIKPLDHFYPDAVVLFAGGLPGSSQVTPGDFKVRVTSLADFVAGYQSANKQSCPFDLSDWRNFAASLSLSPVSLKEAVDGGQVRADLERLRHFNQAIIDEYAREGDRWLHEERDMAALLKAATNAGGCAVVGPSGCGKTLMVKCLAARLAAAESPVLYFAAKDFAGEWSKAVRREIGLLTEVAPSELLRAMASGPNPIFLIVDGINELAGSEGVALRGLRALARRLDAKIVLSSQTLPEGFDGLLQLVVDRPSAALKRRIAERSGQRLSDAALELLKVVGSGFEAEMIGGVGVALASGATRLGLIDQFVRVRLGPQARSGAFALRHFASVLHNELAFSMTEARFDELMRGAGISFETCDAIFSAELLVRRVGRVSFFHEMIFNACAAFSLGAVAADNPQGLGNRMSTSPLLKPLAGEIITAIEDAGVCRRVLEAVTRSDLIAEAAVGSLGPVASVIARELVEAAKSACIVEIEAVGLELDLDNPAYPAQWTEAGRRQWTPSESACLGAIGQLATSPVALQVYLDLCAAMDARLQEERIRLAPALKAANIGLRSASFALAYYGFGSSIGFTKIAHHGPRGQLDSAPAALPHLDVATLSSGQLHFYLENRHWFFGAEDRGQFAEELIYVLRDRFAREPYHVQLAILHAVTFDRELPDETRAELAAVIDSLQVSQSNWGINSSIIDALKFLGALDEESEGARDGIRSEIAQALADDADGYRALSVYTRMFDHPFDSIYCEEIHRLTDGERHTLYRRALGSADVMQSLSLRWLANEIVKLDDRADVGLLARFTALPDRSNPFPQEEWGAFTASLRFLGRHGADLPPSARNSPTHACLSDIRVLVYAAESRRPEDLAQARAAWDRLHALPSGLVVGCLSEVHAALTERYGVEERKAYGPMDLRDQYASDSLRLARRFVMEAADPEYFHNVPMRERGPALAFETVGHLGDRTDIEALRRLGRAHRYSSFALEALKALDTSAA